MTTKKARQSTRITDSLIVIFQLFLSRDVRLQSTKCACIEHEVYVYRVGNVRVSD